MSDGMSDGVSDGLPAPAGTAGPGVNEASQVLAAVLAGRPDLETALGVCEAVLVLADVHPPLPPLAYPEVGIDAEVGVQRALRALAGAVEEAPTAEEALRAGHAARVLREVLEQRAVDVRLLP